MMKNKLFGFRLYDGEQSSLLIEQTEEKKYNTYLWCDVSKTWSAAGKNQTLEYAGWLRLHTDIVILATF